MLALLRRNLWNFWHTAMHVNHGRQPSQSASCIIADKIQQYIYIYIDAKINIQKKKKNSSIHS